MLMQHRLRAPIGAFSQPWRCADRRSFCDPGLLYRPEMVATNLAGTSSFSVLEDRYNGPGVLVLQRRTASVVSDPSYSTTSGLWRQVHGSTLPGSNSPRESPCSYPIG